MALPDTLARFVFWVTVFLVSASYFLYPAVVWLWGKVSPPRFFRRDIEPSLSIIIAAYNEEKNIEKKLVNTLALEYPRKKVEILVGSDGSGDATAENARRCCADAIRVVDFETNRGKTAVQNDLVMQSTGEILVFMDAASFVPGDTLRKMVRNFADPRVGCVAGRMRFVGTEGNLTTQSQGLYWRYEIKLRELESRVGQLVGVDGPLYAVRRDCYVPLPANAISDLLTPLLVLDRGRKVILEQEAYVDEETKATAGEEFLTRRRLTLRGLVGLHLYRGLWSPVKSPLLWFQVVFHKIVRWCVGPLVLFNLAACLFLVPAAFFRFVCYLYLVFFGAAAAGLVADRASIKVRLLSIPYYFCLVNLAAGMGFVDFLRRRQSVTWKPVRS